MRRVTMSARSSCSRARTITTKSISPVTEYTSDTPATAARSSPILGSAPRSAVMSTTAVIIGGSEALDVDVVQCGLHEMRGFLVAHRLTALERGLIRLVRVLIRPFVVTMEPFLELVDGELDAVASGAADQEGPPGASSA